MAESSSGGNILKAVIAAPLAIVAGMGALGLHGLHQDAIGQEGVVDGVISFFTHQPDAFEALTGGYAKITGEHTEAVRKTSRENMLMLGTDTAMILSLGFMGVAGTAYRNIRHK